MQDCEKLLQLLNESVLRNRADALLLSGGLDSTILASMLHPKYSLAAGFGDGAPDLGYARQAASRYSKSHVEIIFNENRMKELVEYVVQVLRTFDPIEIKNSVVPLAGIEQARKDGYSVIMTGDGGDELFAGYNYLSRYYCDMQRLDLELRRLWQVMNFSSIRLGKHAGVDVKTPFLDEKFSSFAKSISVHDKVGEHNGRKWGKFILRKCCEATLGELAWRPKLAQEQGAATDKYKNYVEVLIDDLTFLDKTKLAKEHDGVKIRSKEHLHYYTIFKKYFRPPNEEDCKSRCPECQGCIASDARFCRTCGGFPVIPEL